MADLNDKRALGSILAAGAMLSLLYAAVIRLHLLDILDSPSLIQRLVGGVLIIFLVFPLPLAVGDFLGIFRHKPRDMFLSRLPGGNAPEDVAKRARILASSHSAAALLPSYVLSLSLAVVGVDLFGRIFGQALFYIIPALTLYLVRFICHDGRTGPVFQRCVITLGAGIGIFWVHTTGMYFL